MIKLGFEELAKEIQGKLLPLKSVDDFFEGVSIDSRVVKSGELFIAIRGEINDGHAYVDEALKNGAYGLLVDNQFEEKASASQKTAVVVVENTHEAMMEMARNYRKKCNAKVIGITGSNGKTTTKEYAFALLKTVEKDVYRSTGNLNNLFGAPLAIFAMPQNSNVAVMEMGISVRGEMTRLTRIVQPDLAVITNIGPSHLEFLSSVEDVARAKLEIVSSEKSDCPLIINADDKLLIEEAKKVKSDLITFAIDARADFKVDSFEKIDDSKQEVTIDGKSFLLNSLGRHQVYNFLAAYAAVRTLGYDFKNVATAQIELSSAPMRGETLELSGIRIINDAYNANPDSVKAGLEAFESLAHTGRRVLILGDMLELGEEALKYHERLGASLTNFSFELALLVGPLSGAVIDGAVKAGIDKEKLIGFADSSHAASEALNLLKQGDLVYVKGSRGIGLEKIIDLLKSRKGHG
ncbi:MAG: UDP-N-acetylmuramoyl-tripeptide--D-alanyl-D-alanine ligase [candidate division Zixibacteria bacterium]|nr:UDP-N-acetylmuramoyl-tripeptide--D-alanyl-D-alanine ligase [candidate division Zixibacteria bacterium]